ncbi:MAG: hypothetical protein AB1331_03645 [Bacillota bacterium]
MRFNWSGLVLIGLGLLFLLVNLGFLPFSVTLVAAIPFLLGMFFILQAVGGRRERMLILPGSILTLVSVPLYLTLAGYSMERWWALWVLAPGLAFFTTAAVVRGAWWALIPGTACTVVGAAFLVGSLGDFGLPWALTIGRIWPLLLIGIGLALIAHGRRRTG